MIRIIFMGTPAFAVPSLEALAKLYDVITVVTQPDRPVGRGRRLAAPPAKGAAQRLGLTVLQPRTLRDASVVSRLRALKPTIIVVAAYGEILKPDVLSIPPLGCINVHASLLPRYRGAAPVAAAILQGETETGATMMLMDSGLDTGPILAQIEVPIHPSDTTISLGSRLARQGALLLVETLPLWLDGRIVPQPQDHEAATYAPLISKADGLIDWSRRAEEIDRQCRAYDPWPGVFTSWDSKRLKVLRAHPLPENAEGAAPGTVIQLPEGIVVSTGQGTVLLEKIQLAGKRAMSATEFARGQRGFVGSQLGTSQADSDRATTG